MVEGNKDKPLIKNYTQMYEFIQNKKADHLMALEEFVMSYDEFEKLVIKSKEKQVPVNTIIQAMVNSPGHFPTKGKSKKKSLYLTASSWIDNEYNRQNHKG